MSNDGRVSDEPRPPEPALEPATETVGIPEEHESESLRGNQRRLLAAVAAVAFLLDLATKVLVVATMTPGRPLELLGTVVQLRLVRNGGAAFSMATGMTWLLTLIAVAVVIGVWRMGRTLRSRWWALGLGLILGGALGNLVDRLLRAPGPLQGHVVDFLAVGWWPVFNLADSAIVCGATGLVVLTVLGLEPDGTGRKHPSGSDKTSETSAAAERSISQ